MAIRKLTLARFEKLVEASERARAELLGGFSPGYVAGALGISRQAVHKAIHRGDLDAVMIMGDEDGKLKVFLIPEDSMLAFARKRMERAAG
jgi:hypothetical protein